MHAPSGRFEESPDELDELRFPELEDDDSLPEEPPDEDDPPDEELEDLPEEPPDDEDDPPEEELELEVELFCEIGTHWILLFVLEEFVTHGSLPQTGLEVGQ